MHGANLYKAKLNSANLRWAKLHGANLYKAKLNSADLQLAELYGADLSETELRGADLSEAKLYGADLLWTKLHGADLEQAELHGANLWGAELHGANLSETKLYGANLYSAKLRGADFRLAELYGANLSKTELRGADLRQAILKNTNLSNVSWDKPRYWSNIISNIRNGLKERGLADNEINRRVSRIKRISSKNSTTKFGFIPPTTPIAADCVLHSGQEGPFTGWPEPTEECYLGFISAVVEVACQNQWTAKSYCRKSNR